MRILLLTHAFNSLTQRLFCELRERGHQVTVEFDVNDAVTAEAVALAQPDLVIAPFLKRALPEAVWRRHVCLVVHPGPPGDRGPSALDWAILDGAAEWGVTVLRAEAEMDGGPVWESQAFAMAAIPKSSLYRNQVTEAAVAATLRAVDRFPHAPTQTPPLGPLRRAARQADRAIDWAADDTATVLRKIRSADGVPGLRDEVAGQAVFLHDAHASADLSGPPGELIGQHGPAICRATIDGAVWIGHLRAVADAPDQRPLKLPATTVLADRLDGLPEIPGYRDLWVEHHGPVALVHFPFHNGAMATDQCQRLRSAFGAASRHPATKVIVLMGGPDFWSNGIHLGSIEAAERPADESWRNINAIDDLARDIITCEGQLTMAALAGNSGAGGVFLALAADMVVARSGVVLNPHYKGMGNLYGSEYWTYLLPRRAGPEQAAAVTGARLPVGTAEARRLGLIDDHFGTDPDDFRDRVLTLAIAAAADPALPARLNDKRRRRADDEAAKPLDSYRREELERMKLNFYGFDPSYHVARFNFIHKVPKSRTPLYLANHRRKMG